MFPHSATRQKAALAALRQLSALDLPDGESIPEALRALHGLVGSDTNHMVWTNDAGRPMAYRGEGSGNEAELHTYFNNPALRGPLGMDSRAYIRTGQVAGWTEQDRGYADTPLYQRVMRPMGGGAMCTAVLSDDSGRARGILVLMRESGRHRFQAEELRTIQDATRLMGQLFQPRPPDTPPHASALLPAESGFVLLDGDGHPTHADHRAQELLRLAGYGEQGLAAFAQWLSADLADSLRELCRRLRQLQRGHDAAPARTWRQTPWGRFLLEARLLSELTTGTPACVGLTITRHLPAAAAYWRAIESLALPERQRQVCLDFARGHSLSEIAETLGLSRNTVIDHVNRLYERFGLPASRDALRDHLLRQLN